MALPSILEYSEILSESLTALLINLEYSGIHLGSFMCLPNNLDYYVFH